MSLFASLAAALRSPRVRSRRAGGDLVWGTLLLLGIAAVFLAGGLRPLDDAFAGFRFNIADRAPSQTLTVVEIDSRSLRAAGAWPWDRSRYAQAVETLVDAGATVVALDVDFSSASNPASDRAFAEAISRHPGQVALANFVQKDTYGVRHSGVVENTPLPAFRRDALLASVNVPVDRDGKVREYDVSPQLSAHPSVAALLAGSQAGPASFDIDFGIDPRAISHLSFEDVIANRFDHSLVSGRVILIGATALELGDEFATPSGLMPGVYIHGLAYEALVGGRALRSLHPVGTLALCGLLVFLLRPGRRDAVLKSLVARHALAAAALLLLPILIQALAPISLDIAPLVCTQLLMAIWATRAELARRARAIVEEREAGLVHLATHQPETGLPNRRALVQEMHDLRAARPGSSLAVVTLGVARHAEMRGVVGYNVADSLLATLAQRTRDLAGARVTQVATSALAFVKQDLSEDDLSSLLARLGELETTFEVEGTVIDIFLRIGAAEARGDSVSPDLLIERATQALNRATERDEHVVVYDEAVFGSPANNLALMSEMRQAVAAGDMVLHYQPKMTTRDAGIRSVEALCRWRHPDRGFIPPDLFIPIAEETGQIRGLTEWTLEQAIRDQARLRDQGHEVVVSLNISGRLLTDEAFRAHALRRVADSGARLCFEITETAVIQQPALATEAIAAFRAAGVAISIDDYGSGLSSLGYLKMLMADELKIDKSLISGVLDSQRDRLITKSTVDLAHGLGMSVVAEGVETEALGACLRLLGCDVIQGYWIAKALPLLELADFLDARAARALPIPADRTAASAWA